MHPIAPEEQALCINLGLYRYLRFESGFFTENTNMLKPAVENPG